MEIYINKSHALWAATGLALKLMRMNCLVTVFVGITCCLGQLGQPSLFAELSIKAMATAGSTTQSKPPPVCEQLFLKPATNCEPGLVSTMVLK